MTDWTPEQIEAAAEAVGELRRGWGNPAYDWMLAYKALSAVDLSDHDRAVARAAQPSPDHDYCAWCGWSRERDDSDVDHLRAHVMECPEHPLRLGSDSRDRAVAADALRQAADDLSGAATVGDELRIAGWLRARAEGQVGDD